MNKTVRTMLCAASFAILVSGCAPSAPAVQTVIAPTQTAAGMDDVLKSRLYKLIEEGSTLSAMTIQGVTFPEFRQQLARAKGAYSVALSAQSGAGPDKEIGAENITELNRAFTAWDLALSVWDAKLNGGGAPHAPDAVRYAALVEYVGLDKLPFVSGVPGEGDVDQARVIQMLWGMASDHFIAAQDLLLDKMR